MPLDYVDIKEGKPISVIDAEKTKEEKNELERRMDELDEVVLQILFQSGGM